MKNWIEREHELECQKNHKLLRGLIGKTIKVISYPFDDYNYSTLKILKGMERHIGFRSITSAKDIHFPFDIPEKDHANVFKEMRL